MLGQLQILHLLIKRDGKHTEFIGGLVFCVSVYVVVCMCTVFPWKKAPVFL